MEDPHSRVVSGALELSNVLIIEVLTRMYYLAVTDESIKNRLFKAELLKIALEKYAKTNEALEQAVIILNNNFQEFMDKKASQNSAVPFQPSSVYEQNMREALQSYQIVRYLYIESILPFIQYDY